MNKGNKKQIKKTISVPKIKGRKFLTPKVVWGYAVGQLGWAMLAGLMASIITKVWLGWDASANGKTDKWLGYLGNGGNWKVPVYVFGIIFGGTKLADAFAAPIIGKWSDKTNTKWGRRLPFMGVAIIPMAIITIFAFFAIGTPNKTQTIINIVLLLVLFVGFYIALNAYVIPFTALINDLSKSSEDRVKLTTANAIMYLLGSVLAFTAPILWGMFHKMFGGNYQIAIIMSIIVLSVLAVGFMLIPMFVIKEKKWVENKHDHSKDEKILSSISTILKDTQFKWILLADFFLWIGLIGFNTQVLYVVTKILGFEDSKAIVFSGIMAIVALASYVVIGKVMNKIGVRKNFVMIGFIWFIVMFIGGAMILLFSGKQNSGLAWAEGIALVVLIAIPNAIMGVVKNVILSDIIETNGIVYNEDKSASYYAVRNMTSKIGMAIGMIVSVGLLTLDKELGMRLIFGFGAVMFILGAISLSFYKEVKYRYNREFFKFVEAEKEEIELLAKLKGSKDEKEIFKLKGLIAESKIDQTRYLKISTEKIEYTTTKAINEIKLKISKIMNCKDEKCLMLSKVKKDAKILRLKNDIKAYNIIRTGMSLKNLH